MKRSRLLQCALSFSIIFLFGCSQPENGDEPIDPIPDPPVVEESDVTIYTTKDDKTKLFKETTAAFGKRASMSPRLVTIKPDVQYQTMVGFGPVLNMANCYNLLKMTEEDRMAVLKEVFSVKEGLGVSLIRIWIGSSDFSFNGMFTWCDTPGLANFAIHPDDKNYIFPILHEVMKINPDIKLLASPCSCPKWMKMGLNGNGTYDSWTGGRLDPKYYNEYAQYFVKWIQTMQNEGFPIYAMTIQNEPLNQYNCISMAMPWQEQRDFIKVLGPALENAGLSTKILVYDHNFDYVGNIGFDDQSEYPLKIYNDPEASKYAAGSAWHDYGGSSIELANVHAKAPDKEIYFTEGSDGTWADNFSVNLIEHFWNIFMIPADYGCKGMIMYNLILDENYGPYSPLDGSCKTCFGSIVVSSKTYKVIDHSALYYNYAHASKVIRLGATRVGTEGYTNPDVKYQVYKNPDGTYGVIICNKGTSDTNLVFVDSKQSIKCDVPARSLVSVSWKE